MTKRSSMKNKMKKSNAGLRNTIENKIGRKILEKVKQTRDESSGPIMIPPIPDSKFIDKLPEGELEGQNIQEKEHQDAYEAEVILYRSLEEIEGNFLVIHQLEFTHEQYCAFVGQHLCNKQRCKKGEEKHSCHKEKNLIEGECDMVVLGENFVIIFEVKALNLQYSKEDELKLQGCYESAMLQINRMKELIQSIEPSVMVFGFAVFPNISMDEINGILPGSEKLLFREDIEIIGSIISCCQELALFPTISKSAREKLECCLLGLWGIDPEGHWDLKKSSLSWCIKDIDQKLRKALLTRKSVDMENLKNSSKQGKNKAMKKKYPENPEMVEAPKLFQDYLNIRCLTQDQLDVFNCNERFLWVEGPAGAGKTVAMLGKIIDIVLNKPSKSRILLISIGERFSPALLRNYKLLNRITTCSIVRYVFCDLKNYYKVPNFDLAEKVRSLPGLIQRTTSQIVLLTMLDTLTCNLYEVITSNFDYVFVDDYHLLTDMLLNKTPVQDELNWYKENIVSLGLLPLLERSGKNKTGLWVFYDAVQAVYNNISLQMPFYDRFNALVGTLTHFKSLFAYRRKLTINLRNTIEMSSVLSLIRTHRNVMDTTGSEPIDLPQQKLGHILRGAKPSIHLLQDDNFATVMRILEKELKMFRTTECSVDVAVLPYFGHKCPCHECSASDSVLFPCPNLFEFNHTLQEKYGVRVMSQLDCMSAEWPALICLYKFDYGAERLYSDGSMKVFGFSDFTTNLYVALSRARVYFKAILFNHSPNVSEDTDKLLLELRRRKDVCRFIED